MVTLRKSLKKLGGAGFGAAALLGFAALPVPRYGGRALPREAAPSKRDLEALGKALFFDKTLSNPPGLSCASCHSPETGYSYPDSKINASHGLARGAVKGRLGHRRPPSIAYAPFMPTGLPHFDKDAQAYIGGLFWDGRSPSALDQAAVPLTDPDEMNNCTADGKPRIELVLQKLRKGPHAATLRKLFGARLFSQSPEKIFALAASAIVAYESSYEVSPFSSKFDAYLEGKATLTNQEILGMRFVTGLIDGKPGSLPFKRSAHCMDCHGGSSALAPNHALWTNGCYANLGVPANPANPRKGIDLGLGGFLYPELGYPFTILAPADPLRINGSFKAPTLRNVDKRPSPDFVKCYMHNGVFKNLKDVVHFYNGRNLTSVKGETIDFTKPNPYEGLKGKPLFPRPELIGPSLINPGGNMGGIRTPGIDPDAMQIGNLRLSESQEDAVVAFLKTLSDGYFRR